MHSALPSASYPRQRKYRRFDLKFPVLLSFTSGRNIRKLEGMTQNVSIGGLLVKVADQVAPHTRVRLKVDVRSHSLRRPVRLKGEGEVVRVEPMERDVGFAIAVECKRPISEMERHLPAAG
jgi:PilZ domain